MFYVVEGKYEVQIGDEVVRAVPGTYIFAPRGIPHSFRNVDEGMGRLMILFSPPGFERFFEEVDEAGKDGPPEFEVIVGLAATYGNMAI